MDKLIDYFQDENGDHVYVYEDQNGETYAELMYDEDDPDPNDTGEYYIPVMNELDD